MRNLLLLLGVLCLPLAAHAQEKAKPAPRTRVLYIGMDGAAVPVMKPLLDAGKLPHLGKLVDAGLLVPLQSHFPSRSPAVWTTLATGARKEKHQIYDYVTNSYYWPDELKTKEKNLATVDMRRVPAIWNAMTEQDRTAVVVGWLSTWPAEKIKGAVVAPYIDIGADRQTTIKGAIYKEAPQQMADEAAFKKLQPRLKTPADFGADYRKRYFDEPPADSPLWKDIELLKRYGYTVDWTGARMHNNTESVLALAAEHDPDLTMVYYQCPDSLGHRFWLFRQSDEIVKARFKAVGLKPEQALEMKRRYKDTVDNCYVQIDQHIGRLLEALGGDDLSVVVVSDHGFGDCEKHCEQKIVPFNGGHRNEGLLILSGPAFTQTRPKAPAVEDIPVTLYDVLGVTPPENLDGRVLKESLARKSVAKDGM